MKYVGEYAPDMVDPDTLDLSGQSLEKLGRADSDVQLNVSTLVLDGNNLQRLDNIHTYQCLEKVDIFSEHHFLPALLAIVGNREIA
jgi:hypothetical protein